MKSLEGRINILIRIKDYDDWPYKIVYATYGLEGGTILAHINSFYAQNPDIPIVRRPHLIHVAGKYVILRITSNMKLMSMSGDDTKEELQLGTYMLITRDPDLQGIVWVLDSLQQNATASAQIFFTYGDLINKLNLSEREHR